jgi:hypothetical protein
MQEGRLRPALYPPAVQVQALRQVSPIAFPRPQVQELPPFASLPAAYAHPHPYLQFFLRPVQPAARVVR